MFAALIPFLIQAAASIGSSAIANSGASSRQDAMNAYNTPSAQMARYSAAGLNPNLIYGSGGNAGNQASPAAFFTPDVDPVHIWSAAVAAKEAKTRMDLNRARTKSENIRTTFDAMKNDAQSPYFDLNAHYQSQIMKHTIHKIASQTRFTDESIPNIFKDGKIKDALISEKNYNNRFNQSVRDYGVNANDSPLLRMGALLMKKHFPSFNLKTK